MRHTTHHRPLLRATVVPPRCYLRGRRLHHGLVGLILLATDLRDWRIWVRDFLKHPSAR